MIKPICGAFLIAAAIAAMVLLLAASFFKKNKAPRHKRRLKNGDDIQYAQYG